jgi:signal transduction histidine kinase
MPSGVSTAGAPHDREPTVDELKRELAEAREQQAATAETLRVISSSPMDLKRVFAEIAMSAARLCDAFDATIHQVDGDLLPLVAHYGPILVPDALPLTRGVLAGRAVLDRRTIQVADMQAETHDYPEGSDIARRHGLPTNLAVPLIRVGEAVGVITLRRSEMKPFTERQTELAKTFANQAVIAIENARLFEAVQARTSELTEALEHQTATSEVLSIISTSSGELEPVFGTMLANATRLCEASFGVLFRYDGNVFHPAAMQQVAPAFAEHLRCNPPRPDPRNALVRLLQTKQPIHITDVTAEPAYAEREPSRVALVELAGARTYFIVPMLKEDELIGAIAIYRREVRPFTEKQVQLVASFASQAVIAIANTRLLKELRDSLQQQTATADVLKVISRSPTDLQHVLDTIVEMAQKLSGSYDAAIALREGEGMRARAHNGPIPMRTGWPTLNRGSVAARSVLDRAAVHVYDLSTAGTEFPEGQAYALKMGHRTILAVPLLLKGEAIGTLIVRRKEVRPFADNESELLKTFADQAVIAIENTRLFEAEQSSKRELQESLKYQTATGEVLAAISRSPTELQSVLAEICKTANGLCETPDAAIFLPDGDWLRVGSVQGSIGGDVDKIALTRGFVAGRAFLDRDVVHVRDLRAAADEYPEGYESSLKLGHRTIIGVPLIRNDGAIGVLILRRSEVKPFTDKQIHILKTFADQAVIAIENARLFEAEQASKRELQEALEQQTATAEVLKVISRSALDLQRVLDALVESAARLCDAYDAAILQVVDEGLRFVAHHGQIPLAGPVGQFTLPLVRGFITGRAVLERRTIHVADILAEGDEYPDSRTQALQFGRRTALGVPLVHAGEAIGAIFIRRTEVRPFTDRQIELVNTFADQAVIAIENTRLFEEVQARTRELVKTVDDLELASQHKSQFVANMSHELRTPLAAILGYAELIQEGFYGSLPEKSKDALTRIRSNGKHLLGLINTVLDIAKIESGQFTLNMGEYAIESVVETVRSATESLAQNKKLALKTEVAKPLPVGVGDEQRLTQVLLNLVGNAIKFTDTGEVRVTAKTSDDRFNVSVSDTGPGIPAEHRTRIFEQFQQVDSSNTRAKGGTGLGLAIAKQIVEMHGGRIWVESTLGKGSTFQMELPTRAQFQKRAP